MLGWILGGISSQEVLTFQPNVIDLETKLVKKDSEIADLKNQLRDAKDLKNVLEIMASKTGIPAPDTKGGYFYAIDNGFGVSSTSFSTHIKLPDTVLQYTDDILGGKVIKQEGNKCLVIAKDGTVKTGLTKAKVDKGYTYKLVRE